MTQVNTKGATFIRLGDAGFCGHHPPYLFDWAGFRHPDFSMGIYMAITLHQGDLPDDLDLGPVVAIDSETMGLNPVRDRLCVVQLSSGDGNAHLVQIAKGQTVAPNLTRLLTDPKVLKLFHFARLGVGHAKSRSVRHPNRGSLWIGPGCG